MRQIYYTVVTFILSGVLIAVAAFLAWLVHSLSGKFKAISFDLTRTNQETFLSNAKTYFDNVFGPVKDTLNRYDQAVQSLEKERLIPLQKGLEQSNLTSEQLRKETANLVNALRRPEVRGRWGELTLRRTVELAGMVEHCDFEEQIVVKGKDGLLRPDMVIHLPTDRVVVVDSKVPLDAYLDATSKTTDEERKESLRRHAQQFRQHLAKLANKNYWEQFEKTPEFVVMFVAGEAFLSAAFAEEERLLEEAFENKSKVIPANPSTLMALLLTVAHGWKEVELARNAREIGKLGKELFERFGNWMEYVAEIGKSLEKAVKSYNNAVGSYESRLLVTARKFQELGDYPEEKSLSMPAIEDVLREPDSISLQKLFTD